MPEYIEREALRKSLLIGAAYLDEDTMMTVVNILDCFPAEDVAQVRHGRWVMNSDRPDMIICSNCLAGFDVWKHEAKDFNFCPNCGAKMMEG